ncbi:MAG: SprT-like domain-containing protein [Chromatiaceae bacterium]
MPTSCPICRTSTTTAASNWTSTCSSWARSAGSTLSIRPGSTEDRKQEIIAAWYRQQVRAAAIPLIATWEAKLGVWVGQVHVQRMKSRWGSCNPETHAIRLNSELAKKPAACLEYILAHELGHLLERHHNNRFKALLDAHMPQ